MDNLKFMIDNYNIDAELPLLGRNFSVSSGRNILTHLRSKYAALADETYSSYLAIDNGFNDLEELVGNARTSFESLIMDKIAEVVNDALSVEIFTLDASSIFNECKDSYFSRFYNAYNAFAKPFNSTNAAMQKNDEKRKAASKDAMMRNMTHGTSTYRNRDIAKNMTDGMREKSEAKKKFNELFENQQLRNELKNSVWSCCINLYAYIVDQFPKKCDIVFSGNVTKEDVDIANAIFNNISNPALSEEKRIEFVYKILDSNPYGDNYYVAFAKMFPDNTVEFIKIAEFFRALKIINSIENTLIDLVKENLGTTEEDAASCRALLDNKVAEYGLQKESVSSAYKVIDEQCTKLDIEYRTVEDVLFETREEADSVRADIDNNREILEKSCSEFIFRSDYVSHINSIRELPICQKLKDIYATRYQEKLDEFDENCKLAELYAEKMSGEKRSLKSIISSAVNSSEKQKEAWETITHNGQYQLSDITAGRPESDSSVMGTVSDVGSAAIDKAKSVAGKLGGLFGKKKK